MFVPAAYRNVEDFFDQWLSLVHSSPSFHDYCLRECVSESQFDLNCFDNFDSFLPEDDSFSIDSKICGSKEEEKEVRMDLILSILTNWRKARGVESPRLYEKAINIDELA